MPIKFFNFLSDCHPSCASCSGPSLDQCLSCDAEDGRHSYGSTCVLNCPLGTYVNTETNTCEGTST